MLNELIEKLADLIWTVTITGRRAEVELKDGYIATIGDNGYQIILEIGRTRTYSKKSHYRPGEKYWEKKGWWSTRTVTPTQASKLTWLYDKVVTNGTDEKVSALLDLVG